MRGGEDYSCFTSIPNTKHTFTITKSEDGNKYTLIFLYYNPTNEKFKELTGDGKTTFYHSLISNNLVKYLNENTHNFYYELCSDSKAHNYYKRIIEFLLGYFVHGPHSPIKIKDSVVRNNERHISKEELFELITNTLNS